MPKSITNLWTRNFNLMALSNLFLAVSFYFMMPTLPVFIVKELGESKTEVGYIIAAFTISAVIIRPFVGFWIDKYGRLPIYIISLYLFTIISMGYIFIVNFLIFLLLRFLHGFAWGMSTTSGSTLVVDIIPVERRGEGIGIYGLSMTLAMALAPMIALSVMGEDNYKLLFVTAAAIALSGSIIVLFIRIPKYIAAKKSKINIKNIFAPRVLPIAYGQILTAITYSGIVTFITLYALELGIKSTGFFFFILAFGIGVSRVFSGKIFDKRGPRIIVIFGYFILIAGFLLLSLMKTEFGFLISGLLLGSGYGIVWPNFQAMVNNLVPKEERGAANSTFMLSTDLGIGLGSGLIGALSEAISLSIAYLFCGMFILINLLLFLIFIEKYYKKNKIE
jgi:MFS family permease